MARIPLPERGQPLDLSYIYTMANAINDISSKSGSAYNYVSVDTNTNGRQNANVSDSKFVAGYLEVFNNSTVTAGSTATFKYSFSAGQEFKYPPVVTASPVNIGKTDAGKNVSIVLTSVTKSDVSGEINFNKAGNVSIGINIIAIGIPNK